MQTIIINMSLSINYFFIKKLFTLIKITVEKVELSNGINIESTAKQIKYYYAQLFDSSVFIKAAVTNVT